MATTATRMSTSKRLQRAKCPPRRRRASSTSRTRTQPITPASRTLPTAAESNHELPPSKSESKSGRKHNDYESLTKAAHAGDAKDIAATRPPPPPPPPPLDPKLMGRNLRELGPAAALYSSMKSFYGDRLDIAAYKELLDGVLRDLGDPSDPMERMLAEQAVVAHHLVGRLQSKAANQEKADNAEVYLRGATKLMSEFRKHMELFTRLRTQSSGSPPAPVTPNQEDQPKNIGDTKLASKARKQVTRAA